MVGIPTLLKIDEVCEKIGVTKSCIYRWISENTFPRPLKLSSTCVRWREDDIVEWLEQFASQRGNEDTTQIERTRPLNQTSTPFKAYSVDVEFLQSQVKLAIQKAGGVVALARAIGIRNHQTLYG